MKEADFKRLLDANNAVMREIQRVDTDLRAHVDATAADTRERLEVTRVEMREHMDATAAELREHMNATAAELREHFAATAVDMRHQYEMRTERLEDKIQLVVETVALLDGKVDRMDESIRDEMRRGFADTRDLIRFSHSSLDKRVTALENNPR
jgi:FtsZ-binding cell division protein ZapB/uncharacterized protein YdcH (DUF465 family)